MSASGVRYAPQLHVRSHLENSERDRSQATGGVLCAGQHQPARPELTKFRRSFVEQSQCRSHSRSRIRRRSNGPAQLRYEHRCDQKRPRPLPGFLPHAIALARSAGDTPACPTDKMSVLRCRVMPGHLALILHAHLPFVRHPEHEHFLEEDWLFEAITESYIPLLRMMQRLVSDDVPFKLTMSITPTLCAMLQDTLLRERYVRHLDLLIDLAERECKRNRHDLRLRELAGFYLDLFSNSRHFFVDEWKCDLLATLCELQRAGALEIIASAATHGLLPLLCQQSRQAARVQ